MIKLQALMKCQLGYLKEMMKKNQKRMLKRRSSLKHQEEELVWLIFHWKTLTINNTLVKLISVIKGRKWLCNSILVQRSYMYLPMHAKIIVTNKKNIISPKRLMLQIQIQELNMDTVLVTSTAKFLMKRYALAQIRKQRHVSVIWKSWKLIKPLELKTTGLQV